MSPQSDGLLNGALVLSIHFFLLGRILMDAQLSSLEHRRLVPPQGALLIDRGFVDAELFGLKDR